MINQRYKTKMLYRNVGTKVCQLSVVVLLSACGSGQSDSDAVASGNASASAAQLAEDGTITLSSAQAVGAGLIPVAAVQTSTDADLVVGESVNNEVQLGAAQPDNVESVEAVPTVTTNNGNQEAVEQSVETEQPAAPAAAQPIAVAQPVEPAAAQPVEAAQPVDPAEGQPVEAVTAAPVESEQPAAVEPVEPEQPAVAEPAAAEPVESEQPVVAETQFTASNTEGFTGELLDDGVVRIEWLADPAARGYNVYRDAQYMESVFSEEYIDTDTYDQSYYYEIQAFNDADELYYVALGLTVDVTGTGRINPDTPTAEENILDGYELVFSDEFNGSELDSSKWVTQYLWGDELVINSEEQHYVDILNKPDFGFNPFSFDGESITISSIETPDDLLDSAFGQPYLSGVMTSYDAFKFTYGYVETRAQLPYGKGLWPAFWLLNAYYVDDKPEIDIMEFIGDNQDVVYHTYHYYDADGALRSTHSEPSIGRDFTNGWHTYAVEWSPGTIIFYVDGIEEHRVVDAKVSQQDMYIIANTALGGWWPGSPDSTTNFPVEYKMDYIRAYQKTGILQSDPTEGTVSQLPLWDDVPNASPSHLPPFEVFPQGYPERLGE